MPHAVRCATCLSPLLGEIDQRLLAGASLRSISEALKFSYASIKGHRREGHHLRAQAGIVAPPEHRPTVRADGSIDPISDLESQVRELLAEDPAKMTPSAKLNWYEARRRASEALAKARAGDPGSRSVVSMAEVDGLPEFLGLLTRALEPFPDARDAVGRLMREERILERLA